MIGQVASELMDSLDDDGDVAPRAAMVIVAYDDGDIGRVIARCSDDTWWIQLGLLNAAQLAAEGDTS